jgi:protoheme IX farnesyltransferase
MLRDYYRLAKPGIVYGNLLTVVAGFLFASHAAPHPILLSALVVGMALVIGGSCVLNNFFDRDIDAHMSRTKLRATVTGTITVTRSLAYGIVLMVLGLVILVLYTNMLTTAVAAAGVLAYVGVYTPLKRVTRIHTLIGSIAGAVPILAGYAACANEIGATGMLLFLIMMLWQMPHFYAIAIYRASDYAAAGVPTLLSEAGISATKTAVLVYIASFGLAQASLFVIGATGYVYFVVTSAFAISWFVRALRASADDVQWARGLFGFSLRVLIALSAALAFSSLLP